eukprot:7849072-Pyramimonas_sp.AAC.1
MAGPSAPCSAPQPACLSAISLPMTHHVGPVHLSSSVGCSIKWLGMWWPMIWSVLFWSCRLAMSQRSKLVLL